MTATLIMPRTEWPASHTIVVILSLSQRIFVAMLVLIIILTTLFCPLMATYFRGISKSQNFRETRRRECRRHCQRVLPKAFNDSIFLILWVRKLRTIRIGVMIIPMTDLNTHFSSVTILAVQMTSDSSAMKL
jgi:hypothetical protein